MGAIMLGRVLIINLYGVTYDVTHPGGVRPRPCFPPSEVI